MGGSIPEPERGSRLATIDEGERKIERVRRWRGRRRGREREMERKRGGGIFKSPPDPSRPDPSRPDPVPARQLLPLSNGFFVDGKVFGYDKGRVVKSA